MRFLVDMPLSPALAAWLRDQGHESVHATEIGFGRASDVEVMELANQQNRTVVTADLDYPRLLALARATTPSLILFRDGDWKEAEEALEKSMGLNKGGEAADWFFLAMSHWKLGQKEQARKWYDQAVLWVEKLVPRDEEFGRFRAEAAELLGVGTRQ